MLHIPPLVQVEQDAEDDDLYKLEEEVETEGVGVQIINSDSVSSQSSPISISKPIYLAATRVPSVSQKKGGDLRIVSNPTTLADCLIRIREYAGSERGALIETNDRGREMKWIASL